MAIGSGGYSPGNAARQVLGEPFTPEDVECQVCREAVHNTRARGDLGDLLASALWYERPHLMLGHSMPLCTTCWLHGGG